MVQKYVGVANIVVLKRRVGRNQQIQPKAIPRSQYEIPSHLV
jgi:hypothetical protein